MDLGTLAERMHAEHLEDVPALRSLNPAAEGCGTCQRWAKYALAALGDLPYSIEYDLSGNAIFVDQEQDSEERG